MTAAARPTRAPAPAGRWWPVELLVPKPAPVPWDRATEAAVAIGGAFGAGVLSGHTVDGLLASLGALPVVNGDRGGPFRLRMWRTGGSGIGAVLGLVVGTLVRGDGWPVIVVVAACAAAAGLVSAVNPIGSLFGLNLLVYVAIASSDPLPGPNWRTAAIALAGVAWALAVKLPSRLGRRAQPERLAVAAVYDAIADLLASAGGPSRYDRRWALTAAINQAEDGLVAARTRLGGPDDASMRLLLALQEATPLNRVAIERLATRRAAAPESVAAVRALATVVRDQGDGAVSPPSDPDLLEPWAAARRALLGEETGGDGHPARPRPAHGRSSGWVETAQRMTGRRSLEATGRLVLCMLVAEAFCVYLIHRHPYWVPLTVAVAMKPDFGSVFARAVQRAIGTAIGVVVGGTILVLIADDRELLPFFIVLAALLPVTIARNYGMFVTVLTPLVLIQIDALTPQPGQLVSARLLDTLLGCGIVLLLGYLVWPSTWRPRLLGDVAGALDAVVAVLHAIAATDNPTTLSRRGAYRALSNVRTTLSQHFADPSPTGGQARILWPLVVGLERVLDETVRLASDPRPTAAYADDLVAAADSLERVRSADMAAADVAAARIGTADLRDRVREVVAAVDHLQSGDRPGAGRIRSVLRP